MEGWKGWERGNCCVERNLGSGNCKRCCFEGEEIAVGEVGLNGYKFWGIIKVLFWYFFKRKKLLFEPEKHNKTRNNKSEALILITVKNSIQTKTSEQNVTKHP